MSRRKQARPSRLLEDDDGDGDASAPSTTATPAATVLGKSEGPGARFRRINFCDNYDLLHSRLKRAFYRKPDVM